MMTPIPGSVVIPMLGVPSTLVSIDAHAVAAAVACVGASVLLAWVVMQLQRRPARSRTTRFADIVADWLHPARHAA